MKTNKYKGYFLLCGIICIIVLIGALLHKYYPIKDRVKNIEKYSKFSSKPVGWLRVQGTNIDMPIVYHESDVDLTNPEYDLGWTYSKYKTLPNRMVVVSHNVLNVSSTPIIGDKNHRRFEQLMSYVYYDFVKENKYVQYTTKGKNYLYKIYAISFQKENDVYLEDMKQKDISIYASQQKQQSYFNFKVDVKDDDKLITLITCTRFFGNADYSFVVDARKVRNGESVRNYSVYKNTNYNKIEKKLKGDDKK